MTAEAFVYDPKASLLPTALTISGTAVIHVLMRPGIWFFFGLHLLVFGLHLTGHLQGSRWDMDPNNLRRITGITVFFEVFYTNQCFRRYCAFWGLYRRMSGDIYDFAIKSRVAGRVGSANRCVVVAHLLFLRDHSSQCWGKLLELGLLSQAEVSVLTRLTPPQRSLVLMQAAGNAVRARLDKKTLLALPDVLATLCDYRSAQQEAQDLRNLPIPFQYFHLMNFIVVVNLSAWAYAMGVADLLIAPALFFVSALVFMGLMDLASQLADPFGEDESDFPLDKWTEKLLRNLAALLNSTHPGCEDGFLLNLDEESIRRPLSEMEFASLNVAEVQSALFSTGKADGISRRNSSREGSDMSPSDEKRALIH